jgi:hypothetical protein
MLKDVLEYIVSAFTAETKEINGQIYSTQELHIVERATPQPLKIRNLSGLVDYLVNNYDDQPPVLIQVASPTEVNVYSTYNQDMQRNHLLQATALLPEISFKQFMDVEQFNILLQSCFVPNEDRIKLLAIVGNIRDENVATFGDDGMTQQVTAKAGVATFANVTVPNPVLLKPYRTFVDIPQPESQFVFRMQTGPKAALFEADGGAWKLSSILAISEYLKEKLAELIEGEQVTIIA